MNKATEKKLNEVLERIRQGEDKETLIKNKFSRSTKKYKEFLERIWEEITEEEREVFKLVEEPQEKAPSPKPLSIAPTSNLPLKELLSNPQHIKTFENLILKGGELLNLLEVKQEAQELHVLEVPNDFIELKDLKVSSKRVSGKVEKAFNQLAKENKQYSKTSLLNLAIWEFVQKYKK